MDRASSPFDRHALRLAACGFASLYWELVLIRWLGCSIRIVAYYSNLVLIAAFFGLGLGALLTRFEVRLQRLLVPALAGVVLLGLALAGSHHANFEGSGEFVWIGAPPGTLQPTSVPQTEAAPAPTWSILALVYFAAALVFVFFGQWIGRLFTRHRPLWAYSVELLGSLGGIALFAWLSWLQTSPVLWFAVGFLLLIVSLDTPAVDRGIGVACAALVLYLVHPFAEQFYWSPYYRIDVQRMSAVVDKDQQTILPDPTIGYMLSVNNDYHQMILGLGPGQPEHLFRRSWRALYDTPYRDKGELPEGPILVVGAGTGNDVSAALRNTDRHIVAVEIDPAILELGRRLHPEKPYDDPRVTIVNDDARSFFQNTDDQFAAIVFGFLDSHTLLSSFSSVRLDNFVYTRESMEQARRILRPGGQVWLTFSSDRPWLHERIVKMLEDAFEAPVQFFMDPTDYANGVVYHPSAKLRAPGAATGPRARIEVPTDDWPFLYLESRSIPAHYLVFMALVLVLGLAALLALPSGQRNLRLPYFFLGAAFFLLETSNVVSLSLLFGSTWVVNALVFVGILSLILLGNLTSHWLARPNLARPTLALSFVLLGISLSIAWAVSTSWLLELGPSLLTRGIVACLVFLSPVYFASLIFASLIRDEPKLYEAYGSNVLGAVVGGVCEYLSLVTGFKLLLGLTLLFYVLAMLCWRGRDIARADLIASMRATVP